MTTVVEVRRVVEANHEQLVGIGECGLDFQQWAVPTDEHKLNQRWALEQQICLARYQQHRHGRRLHGPRS
jgi:Tat protein secretion system quality control protein TatD with DNase activity